MGHPAAPSKDPQCVGSFLDPAKPWIRQQESTDSCHSLFVGLSSPSAPSTTYHRASGHSTAPLSPGQRVRLTRSTTNTTPRPQEALGLFDFNHHGPQSPCPSNGLRNRRLGRLTAPTATYSHVKSFQQTTDAEPRTRESSDSHSSIRHGHKSSFLVNHFNEQSMGHSAAPSMTNICAGLSKQTVGIEPRTRESPDSSNPSTPWHKRPSLANTSNRDQWDMLWSHTTD